MKFDLLNACTELVAAVANGLYRCCWWARSSRLIGRVHTGTVRLKQRCPLQPVTLRQSGRRLSPSRRQAPDRTRLPISLRLR